MRETKLSLFPNGMVLYVENPKGSIYKLLDYQKKKELSINLPRFLDSRLIHKSQLYFFIISAIIK